MLAGFLLEEALGLLDKGIHPLKISDGFDKACDIAISKKNKIILIRTPGDHCRKSGH